MGDRMRTQSNGPYSGGEGHVLGLMTLPVGLQGSPCHHDFTEVIVDRCRWLGERLFQQRMHCHHHCFTVIIGVLLHHMLLSYIETAGHSGVRVESCMSKKLAVLMKPSDNARFTSTVVGSLCDTLDYIT